MRTFGKILFLHGLESKPGGSKALMLAAEGHKVLNPELPRHSFRESVEIAQDLIDRERPDVVVGSSRGGAVGVCLDLQGAKLVLVAPAWGFFGVPTEALNNMPQDTQILHSREDDVVPFRDSETLSQLFGGELIECGTCHRMSDPEAMSAIRSAVEGFLVEL
jgi:predicted esterase YcpF (UPF0227 family)